MRLKIEGRFFGMENYDVKPLDGRWWLIQNPESNWGFEITKGAENIPSGSLVIPRHNAETDFASVPYRAVITRLIGPPTGYGKGRAYGPAAIMHDELYTTGKVIGPGGQKITCSKRFADSLFFTAMECKVKTKIKSVLLNGDPVDKEYILVDVARWRRKVMWMAVAGFGKSAWKKHGRPAFVYKDVKP